MKKLILFLFLFMTNMAWSETHYEGLQVDVKRNGSLYTLNASFDTPLSVCAAYRYLTDYDAAKNLPGVVDSSSSRESSNKVKVDRTADEHVLFFYVRLRSVMEYTENPFDRITFSQLSGDSKRFEGSWVVEPNHQGSTIRFQGLWEPNTVIPLFIIDHFAKNGLVDRFSAIAKLAEKRRDLPPNCCPG